MGVDEDLVPILVGLISTRFSLNAIAHVYSLLDVINCQDTPTMFEILLGSTCAWTKSHTFWCLSSSAVKTNIPARREKDVLLADNALFFFLH